MNKELFVKARKEMERKEAEFRQGMNEKYPLSKNLSNYVWRIAYAEGHAHGFSLVEYYYNLLYELIQEVRKEQPQTQD